MGTASWTWDLPSGFLSNRIREGAVAEIRCASRRVWHGRLQTIDRDTGGCIARGTWEDGRGIPALDGAGAVTRDLAVALTTATSPTYQWGVIPDGITGTVVGDASDGPVSVVDLLEQQAMATGKVAGVRADRSIYLRPDPTTPTWTIDAGDLPTSDTDLGVVNRLAGRYRTTTGTYATARSAPIGAPPVVEQTVDLTRYGALTSLQAVDILDQLLAQIGQRPAWTGSLRLHRSQITTRGGVENVGLELITGGQMVSLRSLSAASRAAVGGRAHLNAVLSRAVCTAGSDYVEVEVAGTHPTTLEDAMRKVAIR